MRVPYLVKSLSVALAVAVAPAAAMLSYQAHAAYNGPEDPQAYREPLEMRCYGVPDFPDYYKVEAKADMIGNLVDGYVHVELGGKVATYYFELNNFDEKKKRFEANFITHDTFKWNRKETKGHCDVVKWKPLQKRVR